MDGTGNSAREEGDMDVATANGVCIAVLAAGASRRMGVVKQTLPLGGQPLVRRACETALAAAGGIAGCAASGTAGATASDCTAGGLAGCAAGGLAGFARAAGGIAGCAASELAGALDARAVQVCLVVGAHARAVREQVADLPICVLENPEWEEGQASSVRRAAAYAQAGGHAALMVVPADMPFLGPEHLRAVACAAAGTGAICASAGPQGAMAPCAFPARYYPLLGSLAGDRGAARIIRDPAMAGHVELMDFPEQAMAFDVDTPDDLYRARAALRTGYNGGQERSVA